MGFEREPLVLRADRAFDLREACAGRVVLDWSVTYDGRLVVLSATHRPPYHIDSDEFAREHPEHENHFRVSVLEGNRTTNVDLPPTAVNFAWARVLSDDSLLLVRNRELYQDGGDGVVLRADGQELRRIDIGYCCDRLLVGPRDELWIGFGDQAFNSSSSRGGGLQCLDSGGALCHEHGCICVYALTMCDDGGVYAFLYPDFALIHVSAEGRTQTLRHTPPRGAVVMAFSEYAVLSDGGYDDHESLWLTDRESGARRRISGVTKSGRVVSSADRCAVGSRMYLREGDEIVVMKVSKMSS